jgi:hypothetical protein
MIFHSHHQNPAAQVKPASVLFALGAILLIGCTDTASEEIEASMPARMLDAFLDRMDVTRHWLAGHNIFWETGDSDGTPVGPVGHHTHCSAFVAATCERLGISILRPPEHPQLLLADAQFDWLGSNAGEAAGWRPVKSPPEAQDQANAGHIVVAIWKNPDPEIAGHVAMVRPARKSADLLATEGVDIIQAGLTNYDRTNLRKGFKNHPGAWDDGELRYFMHPVAWKAIPLK